MSVQNKALRPEWESNTSTYDTNIMLIPYILTISVPVVFMARYVMILRGARSLRGALEGVGPENRDYFGPWNGTSEASAIWAQKSRNNEVHNEVLVRNVIHYVPVLLPSHHLQVHNIFHNVPVTHLPPPPTNSPSSGHLRNQQRRIKYIIWVSGT